MKLSFLGRKVEFLKQYILTMKKAKASKKEEKSPSNLTENKRKDAICLEDVKVEFKDHVISNEYDFVTFQSGLIPSDYLCPICKKSFTSGIIVLYFFFIVWKTKNQVKLMYRPW